MTVDASGGHIPERYLGRRLRDAREDAGLKQSELADAIGVHLRTVQRYETLRSLYDVKRKTIAAWALATGVPLTWLETGQAPRFGGPDGGTSVVAGPGFEPGTSGLHAGLRAVA